MKIGKIELTQERLFITIISAIVVIALGLYLVFYAPLMKQLRVEYLECRSVENEAIECRNIIASAGKVYEERVLMTEKDVSHTIDELTRHGKLEGINFISISTKEIKKTEAPLYKILPIETDIKSSYEELGVFLGSLDDLEKGVAKVKSFDIVADKEDPSKLITDLVADMYLSGREYEE